MNILLLVLGIIAIICILIGKKIENKFGVIFTVFSFLAFISCAVCLITNLQKGTDYNAIESEYYATQAKFLESQLLSKYGKSNITIMIAEGTENSEDIKEFTKTLEKSKNFPKVECVTVKMVNKNTDVFAEKIDSISFEDVFNATPDENILISLIGVPADFKELECLQKNRKGKPFVAICIEYLPIAALLHSEIITAAIMPKLNAYYNSEAPTDYQKAFHERYEYLSIMN